MKAVTEGALLWQPSGERIEKAGVTRYRKWLEKEYGLAFQRHQDLWKWSVDQLETFWKSIWEYCGVISHTPYEQVLKSRTMPGAEWFAGSTLNYAEHVFRNSRKHKPALIFQSETVRQREVSWQELKEKTAKTAQYLKNLGVQKGDRVVAYMPSMPETVIAFLACASIGAVWSSCSPDFGNESVIERFKQIEPAVLFAVDGYSYNGRIFDKRKNITELQASLPTLKKTIVVPYMDFGEIKPDSSTVSFKEVLKEEAKLAFEPVPFDHPLWILFSSGTTGLPKPIVQGQGGILLEHLKILKVEQGVEPDDVYFWFTTTGWMMWNLLIGNLLAGATVVLYDGSPAYPDMDALWDLAEKTGMTHFGTSAGYISVCMKSGVKPKEKHDLSRLKAILSTGSPLTAEGFIWCYENVKADLWVVSTSGGTDLCTAFVGGSPVLPVYAGEIQTRGLGANIQAFDEEGKPIVNEVGELVICDPMPSMPLYFWGDEDNKRYFESYFDVYPGVWRHGDWIKIDEKGSSVIYGRSDSTINRQGVRMGTSEIYRAVEGIDEIIESLVIDLEHLGRQSFMPLFVVLKQGRHMDETLKNRIKTEIRAKVSPRFVPDEIYEVEQIPKTLSGKKLEVPIRKILLGFPVDKVVNRGSMANPETLDFFIELAQTLNDQKTETK
ncbi:acetoacetate--CoA ligase [Heyndrickxia coagulans]|uniref:acetoacetate--CoA ligase n=1 Tax=Heyndrickxia coagulans TaxID=1398 RepID=UPI002E0BB080|nr:acetoacetate--CoA ligase [Heyndrickxia coagulans]MEC5269715.1 acetoacetate--CoA ligase [Heyndrickxia coagulans]